MKAAFLKKLALEEQVINIRPNSLLEAFSGGYSHLGYDKNTFSDKISEQLVNTLKLFRNKISPLKKEIVNEVTAKLSFDQNNVKYVNINTIDVSSALLDYIKNIRNNVLDVSYISGEKTDYTFVGDLISFIDVDSLSEDEVKSIFLTGNEELDYHTIISLNKYNIEELKNIIKDLSIIPGLYGSRKVFNNYLQLIEDFLVGYDRVMLTVGFLVKSILDPFRVNLDVEKSKTVKNRLLEHILYCIEDCYRRYESFIADDLLVLTSTNTITDKTVHVLKPTFSKFLEQQQEEENAVDSILGCILYRERYTIENLLKRKDSLAEDYKRYISEQVIANHSKRVANIKFYLIEAFEKQLKLMPEEDLASISGRDSKIETPADQENKDIEVIINDIKTYLNDKKDRELLEVDNIVTEIIGDVIYKDPTFVGFASELRNVMEEYKVITVQQACYIVCVNMIIDKYITGDLLK